MTTKIVEAGPRDEAAANEEERRTLSDELKAEREKAKADQKDGGTGSGAAEGAVSGAAGGSDQAPVGPAFDKEAAKGRLDAIAFGQEKDSKGSAIFDERETAVMNLDLRKLKKRKKDLDAAVKAAGVANAAELQELRDKLSTRRTKWIERTIAAEEVAWSDGRAREKTDEVAKAADALRKAILDGFKGSEPWEEVNGLVDQAVELDLVTEAQAKLMRLTKGEITVLALPTKAVAVKRSDWLVRVATMSLPPELALVVAIVGIVAKKAWAASKESEAAEAARRAA